MVSAAARDRQRAGLVHLHECGSLPVVAAGHERTTLLDREPHGRRSPSPPRSAGARPLPAPGATKMPKSVDGFPAVRFLAATVTLAAAHAAWLRARSLRSCRSSSPEPSHSTAAGSRAAQVRTDIGRVPVSEPSPSPPCAIIHRADNWPPRLYHRLNGPDRSIRMPARSSVFSNRRGALRQLGLNFCPLRDRRRRAAGSTCRFRSSPRRPRRAIRYPAPRGSERGAVRRP